MKEFSESESYAIQGKKLSDRALMEIVKKACWQFVGDADVLESAVGALCVGRMFGWHGLRVIHSFRTFKKYEDALGIKFRDVLPPLTECSSRLAGIRMADKVGKFWQAVTAGLVPVQEGKVIGE